tara:strand:+ start:94 stop:303 length:210 start_codon:yes stop_codon:yes gene_type:complete
MYSQLDVALMLALVATIHGTAAAITETAQRLAGGSHEQARKGILTRVLKSRDPVEVVWEEVELLTSAFE